MSIRIQSSLGMGVVVVSLWLALTTGSLAAGEDTPTGPVLALREKVEAAWNAVQKGDETTARITAAEIVTRWERIPPVVKRLILRTHPELEEVMAGLPDEAASLAREYAALPPEEAEPSKDQTPAETPAPAAQDAEETGEGMIRLNARLLPTNEKPTAAQAATLEKIVIMHRPDRKIVILDQEVKEGRTVVVEGTGKTLQFTRRFTDPANLTLVNPHPSDLEVRHPSQNQWTRVPAYSSATAKVPGGEEDALEIRSTPGCSLLIIKGGAVQSLITTDASAQPAYVKAGEPLHIVMSTPSLQTVTASTTGSPARTILLYPYYPVAYVAASVVPTASAAVEAIYIATPYTQTVTCTTANGQTVTTEVPMATSAAYVVDSPTAVAYADAANGTTTITGANGTTTVTHHGGGIAVQDGNTTKSVRAGTTTVTAPSGESATVGHLHAAAVTKDESGNITGVNYAGASAGVTSTGRAGAAATTVQANDLGSGQGTVEIHSDVVTAGGVNASVDASADAAAHTATVTVTDNNTGTSKTATAGDGTVARSGQEKSSSTTGAAQPTSTTSQNGNTESTASTGTAARTTGGESGSDQKARTAEAPARTAGTSEAARTAETTRREPGASAKAPSGEDRSTSARKPSYRDSQDILGDTGFGQKKKSGAGPSKPSTGSSRKSSGGKADSGGGRRGR